MTPGQTAQRENLLTQAIVLCTELANVFAELRQNAQVAGLGHKADYDGLFHDAMRKKCGLLRAESEKLREGR